MKESKTVKKIENAKKNPKFMKEIKKFIKLTTNPYKLKDYGVDKL